MTRRRLSMFLIVIGTIAIAVTWAVAARSGPIENVGEPGGFLSVTLMAFLVSGALITRRTRRRWTGPLVQVVALAVVLGTTRQGDLGTLSAVYGALWLATLLLPAVLVLDHPDGIRGPWLRSMLAVSVAITAALAAPIVLSAHGGSGASTAWWYTSTPHGADALAKLLFGVHTAVATATLLIVLAVMIRRLVTADRAFRRLLNPVWIPGLVWALATVIGQWAQLFGPAWAVEQSQGGFSYTAPALFLLQVVPFLAVMLVLSGIVWTELVIPRLRRTSAGVAIDAVHEPAEVTRYLASSLGDPSVTIAFRGPDEAPWVDVRGSPAVISDDSDRAELVLRRDGVVLGVITLDAALAAEPEAVELGASAAAFAIDNARLAALANARVEESRRLTARLVTAGDAVRADLKETLDEGPLRELADIELALSRGADMEDAARRLQEVAADVRGISHGVFPPELASDGLAAALPQLASPQRRFAPAIEVTAFLAARNDPLACLRDETDRLEIELSEAPTGANLLDRVTVLGGRVDGKVITLPVVGRDS